MNFTIYYCTRALACKRWLLTNSRYIISSKQVRQTSPESPVAIRKTSGHSRTRFNCNTFIHLSLKDNQSKDTCLKMQDLPPKKKKKNFHRTQSANNWLTQLVGSGQRWMYSWRRNAGEDKKVNQSKSSLRQTARATQRFRSAPTDSCNGFLKKHPLTFNFAFLIYPWIILI